ncbi:MAG: hypothetical protein OXB84_00775 [Halobacteriovoraceae bacterium]|nr:hypothetical protein [Halobacteriovoraceae bacterium]
MRLNKSLKKMPYYSGKLEVIRINHQIEHESPPAEENSAIFVHPPYYMDQQDRYHRGFDRNEKHATKSLPFKKEFLKYKERFHLSQETLPGLGIRELQIIIPE